MHEGKDSFIISWSAFFSWNEITVLKCKWTIFSHTAVYSHVCDKFWAPNYKQWWNKSVNTVQICTSASSWVNCERYSSLGSQEVKNAATLM